MAKRKMAVKDLTVESLPHTRRQLFFDIIKQRWKLLIVLGLLLMVSIFPSVLVLFLKQFSLQNLYNSYDWTAITEEQTAEYYAFVREQTNFWNLFQFPCFLIIALFLSGFMRIIKQLNYSKGIYFFDDFKQGIKQNFLPYLGIFVLVFVIYYVVAFISNIGIDNVFINYLPMGGCIIIFTPLILFNISMVATYKVSIGNLIKNSVILSFKNILWYLIFIVAFFAPFALLLIPYYFIVDIVFLIISIFYYPLFLLANYLFNYALFDLYINKENYPDNYRKGLY